MNDDTKTRINVAFSGWVIRWRYAIIVVTVALVAWIGSGARFLEFSNDYRVFFSEENPQLKAFDSLQNTYTKDDNAFIVLAPKDGTVFTRTTLATIAWLTKEAWKLPYTRRVDSITNFQNAEGRDDELIVRDLVPDPSLLDAAGLERIKRIALSEPLLRNRVVSLDSRVTGVNVMLTLPGESLDEVPEVAAAVRALAQRVRERDANVAVYVTGSMMIDNAFGEHSRKDLATLTPIMYGVILVITALLLRSVSGTVGALLVVAFSTVVALGLTGWFGIKLTPPSVGAPTVILTLAIAHSIHVLLTIFYEMRHGRTKQDAIRESLKINFYPVTLATLTDVIGFLSMNASEVPPFRDLGNIVTIGVLAAYVFSIVFLPAVIAVLPFRVRTVTTDHARGMDILAEFVIRWRTPVLWGTSLVALLLVAMIPRNELNDNFVKYFDEDVEFRRDTDFITSHLAGFDQIQYSLGAAGSGGISDPAYLAKVEEFAVWFRAQPGVVHVTTLVDTIKRLNKNMHGDDPAWYRIPESREFAAQYLLLYELSLPFGFDLNDQINVDKSATRLTVTIKSSSSKEIIGMEERAQEWMRANLPEHMWTEGTSQSIMFAHIGQRNITSMINGNIVALLLISAILIMVLRDLKLGLLSLVPNLLPAAMAFGVWGIFVGQVGIALSVVSVITYGIVVDDTIHSLTKYRKARHSLGMNPQDAVRYTFATAGTAAWMMTVVLFAGFLVLTLSSFELNSSLGAMTALTIGLALAADYLLLPPLLMKFDRNTNAQTIDLKPAVPDVR